MKCYKACRNKVNAFNHRLHLLSVRLRKIYDLKERVDDFNLRFKILSKRITKFNANRAMINCKNFTNRLNKLSNRVAKINDKLLQDKINKNNYLKKLVLMRKRANRRNR